MLQRSSRWPRFPFCLRAALLLALGAASIGLAAPSPSGQVNPLHLAVAPETLRLDEVTLRWEKPADAPRGLVYRVSCDGRTIESTPHTYATVRALAPEHTYVFTAQATSSVNGGTIAWQSPAVTVRTPVKESVVSIERFGAKGDGATLNTRAIQAAIDACPPHGVVLIPPGVFVSGALFLKSDMTLQVAAGGVLQGSTHVADYEPFIPSRFEGWELPTYASLLNAGRLDHRAPPNVRHLSIRGAGTIRGGGAVLGKAMIAAHGIRSRDRLICLVNCADVEVQGLTIENPPCWTLHILYCEDVACHDLTIKSTVANGDGIDPDSSTRVDIFNCSFSTGDDCIAIKSGKNPEGNVVARPTEHVRISDCRFVRGHAIAIGSEMSGGVRDVQIEDCVAGALMFGLQIKGTKDRGGFVEDVTVRDCDLRKITIMTELDYNNDGAPAPEQPVFRHFRFRRIDLTKAKPTTPVILLQGFPAAGHRTQDVIFADVTLPTGAIVSVDRCENVRFTNVTTIGGGSPQYTIVRSENISR